MSNLSISYVVKLYYIGDRYTTGDRLVKELKGDDLTELVKEIYSKHGITQLHDLEIGLVIDDITTWYQHI